jgi:hypothetical protein
MPHQVGKTADSQLYVNAKICLFIINGKIIPMLYKHPDIKEKRIDFAESLEYGMFVEGVFLS